MTQSMKHFLFIAVSFFLFFVVSGQKTVLQYRSQMYAGLLLSEGKRDFHLQTIQGIYIKRWTVGLGGGMDWYRFRTIPFFFSVTRDLFKNKEGVFVTVNAGTNFPALKKGMTVNDDSQFLRGVYWAASMGYKFEGNKKNNHSLILSAGYSYKRVKEERPISRFCPGGCQPSDIKEKITYALPRIDFRVGWQF